MRFGVLMGLVVGSTALADPAIVTLSGHIAGASGKHVVHVCVWSADNFLKTPTKEITIPAGGDLRWRFDVAPGRWAVSAYEDKNDNGTLDVGAFGPKEPNGFWRPFKAWRAPRFDDVDMAVTASLPDATVTLR